MRSAQDLVKDQKIKRAVPKGTALVLSFKKERNKKQTSFFLIKRGLFPYCYFCFFLPVTFSIIFLIPNVMAMQSGKYGVNGPAQNARYAVATTEPSLMPNMMCSR